MAQLLEWQSATDSLDVIHCAVQALSAGRLVAFPTETFYALTASALHPEAVARLQPSRQLAESRPLTLAVRGAADALDWVPGMSPLGRRLARRCWPGPVKLVFGESVSHGLASRLAEKVRQHLGPPGTLGLRVPAHDAIRMALHLMPGPLVLASARRGDEPAATNAGQVSQAFGDVVDLVIDDGYCRFGQASTVVRVNGDTWSILREGVLSAATLERQSARMIVFVCTGNTCRSPLAEALCKKRLAERLGGTPEELPQRGFHVLSAGLAAVNGGSAAAEAVEVAREYGADLSGHRSQPLTAKLLTQADYLIPMTQGHVRALAGEYPRLGPKPRLLSPAGEDIPDPIGYDQEVYRECARQIWLHLEGLVAELAPLPPGTGPAEG
jgi:protein-tyrosine phosphatase